MISGVIGLNELLLNREVLPDENVDVGFCNLCHGQTIGVAAFIVKFILRVKYAGYYRRGRQLIQGLEFLFQVNPR